MSYPPERLQKISAFVLGVLALSTGWATADQVRYVDAAAAEGGDGTSWVTAYRYLQDALTEAAGSGGSITEIRMGPGTYTPDRGAGHTPGDRDATFPLLDGVTIKGGYGGLSVPAADHRDLDLFITTLSGDLAGDDASLFLNMEENSRRVLTGSNTDPAAVLDGVIIAASHDGAGVHIHSGNLQLVNCVIRHNLGVGLYAYGGQLVLTGCDVLDNRGIRYSGGSGILAMGGNVLLQHCRFMGNRSIENGGAIRYGGYSLRLEDCTFAGNAAWDGAAISSNGNITVIRTTFAQHQNGAIRDEGGQSRYEDCWFMDNHGLGAVYLTGGEPHFVRCVFLDNSAPRGGAVFATLSCLPRFTASQFINNESTTGNGGAVVASNALFANCIFIGNRTATEAAIYAYGNTRVDNCTFSGNIAGGPGAGIHAYTDSSLPEGTLTVSNSIFWGNLWRHC